jgi:hypothetical protein
MPAWRETFEAVYRLEEGEMLKRIAPPFIAERMDYYREEHTGQAEAIPRGPDRMIFHWDGKLRNWGMGFGRVGALSGVLNSVVRLKRYEYEGPAELLELEVPGDWIIRDELPDEVKLGALEGLIEMELGRKIRFERRTVERDVIVATGRYRFQPRVGTHETESVHIYADAADRNESSGGGTGDSVGEFLMELGDYIHMPVIDRTEPGEDTRIVYRHYHSARVYQEPDTEKRAHKLRLVLDHVTEQTELTFELATEPVEVWFVSEEDERVG